MPHEVSAMEGVYVLKFGGNVIRSREDMMRLSGEISQLVLDGTRMILVHGGGPEISMEMEKRGLVTKKVGGVRVTDAEGLEIAELVLRRLNDEIVGCLGEASVKAVGSAGSLFTVCRRKAPCTVFEGGNKTTVDLGYVGEVCEVNTESLEDLLDVGVVPVIYPIGVDAEGRKLNVNADTMAAGIAAGIKCRELITITDVRGILMDTSDPGSKIDRLTLAEVDELIGKGVISGGMIPKVEACRDALNAGVEAVRMVDGRDGGSIVTDIMRNIPQGTVIVK